MQMYQHVPIQKSLPDKSLLVNISKNKSHLLLLRFICGNHQWWNENFLDQVLHELCSRLKLQKCVIFSFWICGDVYFAFLGALPRTNLLTSSLHNVKSFDHFNKISLFFLNLHLHRFLPLKLYMYSQKTTYHPQLSQNFQKLPSV